MHVGMLVGVLPLFRMLQLQRVAAEFVSSATKSAKSRENSIYLLLVFEAHALHISCWWFYYYYSFVPPTTLPSAGLPRRINTNSFYHMCIFTYTFTCFYLDIAAYTHVWNIDGEHCNQPLVGSNLGESAVDNHLSCWSIEAIKNWTLSSSCQSK